MKEKSENELLEILDNVDKYQENLIVAAITELEKRGTNVDKFVGMREKIIKSQAKREELMKDKWKVPKDMPDTIRKAAHLMFYTLILAMLSVIAMEFLFDTGLFKTLGLFIAIEIAILISFALAYFILLGRVVARTLFLISYIFGLLSAIPNIIVVLKVLPVIVVLFPLLSWTLQTFALRLLYKKESNDWYKKQKQLLIVE